MTDNAKNTTPVVNSGNAPMKKVGLVAEAGQDSEYAMPIDATLALDQAISPTWTGNHSFESEVDFTSVVSFGTTVTAPTPEKTDSSDRLATTQFVHDVVGGGAGAQPSPADPTSQVGLTTINGTAATFMRSDAAPALNQAISPTWTGPHAFTANSTRTQSTVLIKSPNPLLELSNTRSGTDSGRWIVSADFYKLCVSTSSDDGWQTADALQILRTGAEVDTIVLNAASVTAPTPKTGDKSQNIATTEFVQSALARQLPLGTIIMFSGSEIPDGWLLCDGSNGTPNLTGRFIMGGTLEEVGGQSVSKATGSDKNSKTYQTQTESTSLSVTISPHKLTVDELPPHEHNIEAPYAGTKLWSQSWSVNTGSDISPAVIGEQGGSPRAQYIANTTGGGQPHSHEASLLPNDHNHEMTDPGPYYILCFIMLSTNS